MDSLLLLVEFHRRNAEGCRLMKLDFGNESRDGFEDRLACLEFDGVGA